MFWRKKTAEAGKPETKAVATTVKVKKLSPKDVMRQQIEQLSAEEVLRYKLPDTYGGGLAIVELNPKYPKKGKKYIISTDKLIDGKPANKKSHLFDGDNPKGIANWILERAGELFIVAEKRAEDPGLAKITAIKQPPAASAAS